jgi:exonuclease SbcC
MRPLKLSLINFIGIRAGLGRDELTIDLDTLAGGAALVALIGPNGAGKSTVMDNLHPYRLMPSRATGYSPGSFSFYDQTDGEAKKVLDWEHDGRLYRSTLLIKQTAKTKKTEAYLFAADGIDWIPASIQDGTVSDGKADTYDRIVDAICGSPEMFFTSAFSAQGRRSLSSYANGEIKGLLSELLGLDHIRALGSLANDEVKARRMRLDAQRDGLGKIESAEANLKQALMERQESTAVMVDAHGKREEFRIQVNAQAKYLADMQAAAAGNAEIEIRRAALTNRINSCAERAAKARMQALGDNSASEHVRHTTSKGLEQDISALRQSITTAQHQIAGAQAMQGRAGEVAAAEAARANLANAVTETAAAVDIARARSLEAQNLGMRITSDRNTLAGIIREGKQLAEALGSLRRRADLIDAVPCRNMTLPSACPLLADAHAAQQEINPAHTATEAKRADYNRMQAEQEALLQRLKEMGDTEAALKSAVARADEATKAVRANDAILALTPAIAQAEQIIASARASISGWEASITEKTAAMAQAKADHTARVAEIQKRLDEEQAAINSEASTARIDLDALPPPADTSALAAAELALQAAERALSETDQTIARSNARIGALDERIATLKRDLAGADEIKATARDMEDDIAQWALLAKALGNDGIIALSIDDAGPTLAAYANDLLLSCYGQRFSVSIQTQAETAKGDLKETFDIRVFDGGTGDDKSVRDMSGGQKIYINEAMTRAIALYQAEMHGRHYECLFADESDGALDPERKVQFMRMKRKVLELGGYKSEIFISHTPELWGMADAVINLEDFRA